MHITRGKYVSITFNIIRNEEKYIMYNYRNNVSHNSLQKKTKKVFVGLQYHMLEF